MATEVAADGYDYVIVGAGSAGCVLANRLSADPSVSVALLEAGGRDTNPWIHIPAGYYRNILNPEDHLAVQRLVPSPISADARSTGRADECWAAPARSTDCSTCAARRATTTSGASSATPAGRTADVLPYFKRAEHQERGADDLHGAGGPLGVSDVHMDNPVCDAFVKSCVAEGIPFTRDFNGPSQEGVGYYQLTNRNGRRSTTAVAYLHPIKHRRNLHVITNAEARGIVLDGKRATGVRIKRNGRLETVKARREVILSAGAIGSPQLLQVSGIGPAATC